MPEKRRFICIRCPTGCDVDVVYDGRKVVEVTGHQCEEGVEYVTAEIENPERTLTTTVRIRGGVAPVVSVRSEEPIPRDALMTVMRELAAVELEAPVCMGSQVLEKAGDTGVAMVATRTVERASEE